MYFIIIAGNTSTYYCCMHSTTNNDMYLLVLLIINTLSPIENIFLIFFWIKKIIVHNTVFYLLVY